MSYNQLQRYGRGSAGSSPASTRKMLQKSHEVSRAHQNEVYTDAVGEEFLTKSQGNKAPEDQLEDMDFHRSGLRNTEQHRELAEGRKSARSNNKSNQNSDMSRAASVHSYVKMNLYGGLSARREDQDRASEILGGSVLPDMTEKDRERLMQMSPASRQRELDELASQSLLGPCSSYLTLIKGFICTGCLYLPRNFYKGGWIFQTFCLLFACALTMYCAHLLLQTRQKLRSQSYTEMGEVAYGRVGRIAVDISLFLSQAGFVCAYIYFIKENLHHIIIYYSGVNITAGHLAAMCFVLFTLMCLVRRVEVFAAAHVFADVMIVVTMVAIMVYGGLHMRDEGRAQLQTVPFLNTRTYTDAIGFSIYCYEGMGVIMPVEDITRDKKQYKTIVMLVIASVALIYITFGMYCAASWGEYLNAPGKPLITDLLPDSAVTATIKVLFSLNLIFSYPLVLHPSHTIVENYLYKDWKPSATRTWLENFTRMAVVGATVGITVGLAHKIDNFLSILGAVTCTPIAFTFPALFHFKICAESSFQKALDLTIVAVSAVIFIFCTVQGIQQWNA